VLDSSAVLAYLGREVGFERVRSALVGGAVISTVNLAEVYVKLVAGGVDPDEIMTRLSVLGLDPLPFLDEDALESARFYPGTRAFGLSLGDRACLSLAARLKLPVLTADRVWEKLDLGVEVRLIR
jgi:PIN domain nuclease of toxin-antitoxin system